MFFFVESNGENVKVTVNVKGDELDRVLVDNDGMFAGIRVDKNNLENAIETLEFVVDSLKRVKKYYIK